MSAASRFSRVSGPTALVVSVFSLVVGLGGVSVAAVSIAKNSVGSAQIKNGSVKTADLANNSVTSPKIKDGQVGTADLANNAVTSAKIKDGQVGGADLAKNSVTSTKIADGTITAGDIAAGVLPTDTTNSGWAYVAANGTVLESGGKYPLTTSDITHTTGTYQISATGWGTNHSRGGGGVVFFRYGTLPEVSLAGSGAGQISVTPASANILIIGSSAPTTVYTFNAAGAAADHDFLVVLP